MAHGHTPEAGLTVHVSQSEMEQVQKSLDMGEFPWNVSDMGIFFF